MALNENQRRIVEGVRRCDSIKVIAEADRTTFEMKVKDKGFSHDIAIAIQKYFNEQN